MLLQIETQTDNGCIAFFGIRLLRTKSVNKLPGQQFFIYARTMSWNISLLDRHDPSVSDSERSLVHCTLNKTDLNLRNARFPAPRDLLLPRLMNGEITV